MKPLTAKVIETVVIPADYISHQRATSGEADVETYLLPSPLNFTDKIPLPSQFKGKKSSVAQIGFGYRPLRRPVKRIFGGNPVQSVTPPNNVSQTVRQVAVASDALTRTAPRSSYENVRTTLPVSRGMMTTAEPEFTENHFDLYRSLNDHVRNDDREKRVWHEMDERTETQPNRGYDSDESFHGFEEPTNVSKIYSFLLDENLKKTKTLATVTISDCLAIRPYENDHEVVYVTHNKSSYHKCNGTIKVDVCFRSNYLSNVTCGVRCPKCGRLFKSMNGLGIKREKDIVIVYTKFDRIVRYEACCLADRYVSSNNIWR